LTLRRQVLTTARRRTPLSLKSSTFFLPVQKIKKIKKIVRVFPDNPEIWYKKYLKRYLFAKETKLACGTKNRPLKNVTPVAERC